MRVELDDGGVVDLGVTETTPTIGIIDYSRRVTDDFGVTTVVERGFARRMSVRCATPSDGVDALQRRLADLRATPALWVADDRYTSLSVNGFYKDFNLDLAVPPISYCTLTVEGLAVTEPIVDTGGDPAPDGQASTLQLLQPVIVTDDELVASSVAEDDYPEWSGAISYPFGARAIKAATHRIYESAVDANSGNDPAGDSGLWIDIGPTNRWAMFDQALGTVTSASGSITVTLDAGPIEAVALLDVVASTVRVQAAGYDQTVTAGPGAVTFLDLLGVSGEIIVTIAGTGEISVGTLLIGALVGLGITEASPSAGITDYSRKVVDEFGDVTVVQRAWAKRMSAHALISADALDNVVSRIATVRARPSLWIGQAGVDVLTIYGFFKDFSIEVAENVSKLSLSIEGMSTAAKVEPLKVSVDWPDIGDPDGTKPEDNATVGAPTGTPVAGVPAEDLVQSTLDAAIRADAIVAQALESLQATLRANLSLETLRQRIDELTHMDGKTVRMTVRELNAVVETATATITANYTELISAIADETGARVEAITLLTASVESDIADVTASILDEAIARADADSAEATARETLAASVASDIADVSAAVLTEATARATADTAEATTRAAAVASLISDIADVDAAIITETSARVSADAAEVTARETLAASLTSDIADVSAAVVTEATARATADTAEASAREDLTAVVDDHEASITDLREVVVDPQTGVTAKAIFGLNADGHVVGYVATNDGTTGEIVFRFDSFTLLDTDDNPLFIAEDGIVKMPNAEVGRLKVNLALVPVYAAASSLVAGTGTSATVFQGYTMTFSETITVDEAGYIDAEANVNMSFAANPSTWQIELFIDGVSVDGTGGVNSQEKVMLSGRLEVAAGTYTVELKFGGYNQSSIGSRKLKLIGLVNTE